MRGLDRPGLRFVTLTIDPSSPRWQAFFDRQGGPEGVREAGGRILTDRSAASQASIRYLAESWNRLRTRLVAEWGTEVAFFRGVELHKSGIAHMHVLIALDSLEAWLGRYGQFQAFAVAAGFGRKVDIQQVRSPQEAARYVGKAAVAYTAKGEAQPMPRYTRRAAWSRGWCEWTPPTPVAGFEWSLGFVDPGTAARALEASGYVIEDPGRYRVVSAPSGAGGS